MRERRRDEERVIITAVSRRFSRRALQTAAEWVNGGRRPCALTFVALTFSPIRCERGLRTTRL